MTTTEGAGTFTAAERAAMKDRAAELRAEGRAGKAAAKAAQLEADVLAKIAELPDEDRTIAERIHTVVGEAGPDLAPRTWYGMPAYTRDGKVVVYVKPASKFGQRYTTLGFEDAAALDDGDLWATSYAVTRMTDDVAERVAALVRRAAGGA